MKPVTIKTVNYVRLTFPILTAYQTLDKKILPTFKNKMGISDFCKIFPHSFTCMRMEAVFSVQSCMSDCDTLLSI